MDSYAPCPCGSGKKLKFCCQAIIGEMEKIERLQENNQTRMALQLLEKLEKSHPTNPWVVTHKALALLDDDRAADAEACLKQFLRGQPEHPFANALYGFAAFNAFGYPESKKAVHRAFRRGASESPDLVGTLAANIAGHFINDGRYMAARAHMALTLRLSDAETRKRAFLAMVELDGDTTVPYPLRGPHTAPAYQGPESHRDQVTKAHRLSALGCWQEAAEMLAAVAQVDPESAAVWHTIGLFHAWDGNESAAADALHRAARLHADIDTAVEVETVAQLLEQYAPEHTRKMRYRRFRVESVSRLLSQLDAAPQCARVDSPGGDGDEAGGDAAARYIVLHCALAESLALGELTRDTVPIHRGRIAVFDRSEDDAVGAQAFLSGLEGPDLDDVVRVFTNAAGELATPVQDVDALPDSDITGIVPDEQTAYFQGFYFPPRTPGPVRRRIQQAQWDDVFDRIFPESPLRALGGRSPRETSGVPEIAVARAAAVEVLDAFCASRGYILPAERLRERLGVPAPTPVRIENGANLNTLSLVRLRRVELESLNDDQLKQVVNRVLLARHPAATHAVLTYVLERDRLPNVLDRQQICSTLSDVCRDALRMDEALQWNRRGLELVEPGETQFAATMQWKMREVVLRIDNPDDPRVADLLRELWHHYGSKVPSLRERLMELVAALGIEPPWEGVVVASGRDALREAAAWSPETVSAPAPQKKLWLPGDR